jgi:TonB family protein
MIAAWMLYCVGIGLAFVVAGHATEWALHLAGRQTRWAWCVALAGSLLVPAAAWLAPEAFSAVAEPLPQRVAPVTANIAPNPGAETVVPLSTAERPFSLSDLDGALRWGWGLSSAALLLVLTVATLRLAMLRRRWHASVVDGRRVLVSENVGPAVAGLVRPWIVVPSWALQLGDRQRELMLTHEEEHLRAGDPRLLAWGALALVLAPWNPALWWQLRRLRLAVEMDCDARVLARQGHTPEYGELLLQVSRRRGQVVLGAPALGEPISFLEHRIRRMATVLPRWRWLGAGAGLAVAASAVIGACETPRPSDEASRTPESSVSMVFPITNTLERVPSRAVLIRWMRSAIAQTYAEYLTTPANPSVDLWFHGTTGGRVIQSTRTGRTAARMRFGEIEAHLPEVGPIRPGTWFGWAYPLGPGREDVRAIWVYDSYAEPDSVSPPAHGQAPDHEQPDILSGPRLQYPDLLRHAGIQGRVIVQAIIDTTGRAEPQSVKVIQSTHPGFNQSATNWVLRALFRPARAQGHAVRALMNVPIEFKM